MTDRIAWDPLRRELDRWQAAGRVARFWLRDDDAVEPTLALEMLMALAGENEVPLMLAVIPGLTGEALAVRLGEEADVAVAVHGWSHKNHAGLKAKKQELGGERPTEVVLDELGEGFRLLERLHPARFLPVLVPPWNRIDAALIPALPALGLQPFRSTAGQSMAARCRFSTPMWISSTGMARAADGARRNWWPNWWPSFATGLPAATSLSVSSPTIWCMTRPHGTSCRPCLQ